MVEISKTQRYVSEKYSKAIQKRFPKHSNYPLAPYDVIKTEYIFYLDKEMCSKNSTVSLSPSVKFLPG